MKTSKKKIAEVLKNAHEVYLDYFNNYLTVAKFAEHNEISEDLAMLIVGVGREAENKVEILISQKVYTKKGLLLTPKN